MICLELGKCQETVNCILSSFSYFFHRKKYKCSFHIHLKQCRIPPPQSPSLRGDPPGVSCLHKMCRVHLINNTPVDDDHANCDQFSPNSDIA